MMAVQHIWYACYNVKCLKTPISVYSVALVANLIDISLDFTEKELNMITEAGATKVGLGPRRLCVETATMALLATLMLWSDSQQTANS